MVDQKLSIIVLSTLEATRPIDPSSPAERSRWPKIQLVYWADSIGRRNTQRLAEAGAVASVGSTGDSYDNAFAEGFNSLFKAELARNKGPWKSIDDLEIAVAEYIDWFNHRRLHGEIGLVPPAEHEGHFYRHNTAAATAAASVPSLH
jgi:transposase InsO family protein